MMINSNKYFAKDYTIIFSQYMNFLTLTRVMLILFYRKIKETFTLSASGISCNIYIIIHIIKNYILLKIKK